MSVQTFRSLSEAMGRFGPCALAIGNFDGVHIGHQALIRAAVEYGKQQALAPAALTFDPHPSTIVAPERTPLKLCTLDERIRLLHQYGARHVMVLPFTRELSQLSPQAFISEVLLEVLGMKAVFVGKNFRFGHKQAGNTDTLREQGLQCGFAFEFLEPVVFRGEIVSSSAIRRHILAGRVARAGRLLGRCFALEGPVVSGQGIGSKQTVPTLNLEPRPDLATPRGVFVTETCECGGPRRWESITNVGTRPTFGGHETTIETYLLSPFDGNTPEHISVRFHRFIRQERSFDSPQKLKAQILKDVGRAQAYWRRRVRAGRR